jgi:hypothetical protein
MTKHEKWRTAEEVIAEQNSNPEFLRKKAEKEERRRKREAEFAAVERPLLDRMKSAGYEADSIIEAIKKFAPLPDRLVAILLEAVTTTADIKHLEWIIRALAATRHPFDGRPLMECYQRVNDINLRWVILNTIACSKPHSIGDWIEEITRDPYVAETLEKLGYYK